MGTVDRYRTIMQFTFKPENAEYVATIMEQYILLESEGVGIFPDEAGLFWGMDFNKYYEGDD